jgi:hypothetical protein
MAYFEYGNDEQNKKFILEKYKVFVTQLFMDFYAIPIYVGDFEDIESTYNPHTRLKIRGKKRFREVFAIQTIVEYVPVSPFEARMKGLELAINTIKEFRKFEAYYEE